ncbi:hypothetical protein NDU88_004837 [Pleurodeles waltl]|uniref:Uncharacterized protein n=1 Tax=Pleurodeles waltl TaxID=8319 RepID=A0AAV7V295_PLEWA|nr:hypothetical protein NDU88_004837 [Pleurodeles waltl]
MWGHSRPSRVDRAGRRHPRGRPPKWWGYGTSTRKNNEEMCGACGPPPGLEAPLIRRRVTPTMRPGARPGPPRHYRVRLGQHVRVPSRRPTQRSPGQRWRANGSLLRRCHPSAVSGRAVQVPAAAVRAGRWGTSPLQKHQPAVPGASRLPLDSVPSGPRAATPLCEEKCSGAGAAL